MADAPWSDLHADALHLISQKLTLIFEYVSCSVCTSWRFAADPLSLPLQTPILTIPYDPGNYEDHIRKIFFLDTRRVCNLSLPEARNKRCLTFTGAQIPLPPITTMPGILNFDPQEEEYTCDFEYGSSKCYSNGEELCEEMVLQVAITSDPSAAACNDDCVVMVTLSENTKLALCKLGDNAWTGIDTGSRNTFGTLTCYKEGFMPLIGMEMYFLG